MTPQLQQAIRLLQLSSLELSTEIQEALETNPLLEAGDNEWDGDGDSESGVNGNENDTPINGSDSLAESRAGEADTEAPEKPGENESAVDMQSSEIPEDLPVDTAWDDVYDYTPSGAAGPANDDDRDYETGDTSGDTLREHLLWQMRLTPFSDTDVAIATAIIDSTDEDGYLSAPLDEIHQGLDNKEDIDGDEVEAVLRQLQNFDPPGACARDLRECLLIQLRQLDAATPWRSEAQSLVREHLNLLASHEQAQLMRRMKLDEAQLAKVVTLVRSLNPRPGSQLSAQRTEYIVPDVMVRKFKGVWRVELNPDIAPRLRINNTYASMIRRADNSSDNVYLKNHLQEARWFLKSLQSRNETLLKVATAIVERQRGFLEYGEEAMRALVLHDIAETVEMHESTISRVTTRKYMHTPRGIFELKYFFSSHVSTAGGGECSSTAIRAFIKKLIQAEDAKKPLSDSKIANLLSDQGIKVARRTVAKYREAMSIPPSNERKRLI